MSNISIFEIASLQIIKVNSDYGFKCSKPVPHIVSKEEPLIQRQTDRYITLKYRIKRTFVL